MDRKTRAHFLFIFEEEDRVSRMKPPLVEHLYICLFIQVLIFIEMLLVWENQLHK